MAGVKILVAAVAVFVIKDGALSCSLRSHKSGSSLCSSSDTDSTLIRHHTATHKLHKSASPCDSSSISGSSSSNVLPSFQNVPPTPFTPIFTQAPTATFNYDQDIINVLTKFLSSPWANINSTLPQILPSFSSVLPSGSSPSDSLPSGSSPSGSSASGSLPSGSSSSIISNLSSGPALSTSGILVPGLQWPGSTTVPTPSVNPNIEQILQKLSMSVPKPVPLHTSQPTSFPPHYPLFIPALNLNPMPAPVLKPHKISYPTIPGSSSHLKNVLAHLPCGSSTQSKFAVPKEVSEPVKTQTSETVGVSNSTTAQDPESISTTVSEVVLKQTPKYPSLVTLPTPIPIHFGYDSDIINHLLELLSSNHTPTFNMTPILAPVTRPHTISSSCTTLFGSKSNASSVSPSKPCGSIVPQNLMPVPVTPQPIPVLDPTFTSGISYGYNPSFLNHLYEQLRSNSTSLLGLNTTMLSPSISNTFQTTTPNESLPDLNSNIFNIISNLSADLGPALANIKNTTNNNNNEALNFLYKLLFPTSNVSETPISPPMSPSSQNSINLLNNTAGSTFTPNLLPTSNPYTPSFDPSSDLFSTLTIPTSGSIQSSVNQSPVSVTPLSIIKPFSDTVSVPTLSPNPCRSSDVKPCRLKHSRPSHLPGSTPLGTSLCQKNASRPLTPHSTSPYSLYPSKLSSGCKHS